MKERLKNTSNETRALKTSGVQKPAMSPRIRVAAANVDDRRTVASIVPEKKSTQVEISVPPARIINDERVAELVEDVRGQAAAASDVLLKLNDVSHDDSLRSEIADIAAKMIAITGQQEGATSPIRTMISGKMAQDRDGRLSLSERAAKLIHQQ